MVGSLGDLKLQGRTNTKIVRAVMLFERFSNKSSLESLSDNKLVIHPDILKPLPSLRNVMGMFKGCNIDSGIPFDLFKKRTEKIE